MNDPVHFVFFPIIHNEWRFGMKIATIYCKLALTNNNKYSRLKIFIRIVDNITINKGEVVSL